MIEERILKSLENIGYSVTKDRKGIRLYRKTNFGSVNIIYGTIDDVYHVAHKILDKDGNVVEHVFKRLDNEILADQMLGRRAGRLCDILDKEGAIEEYLKRKEIL